jgi:hypothetical protein
MTSEWKAQVVGVNYYIDNTSLENLTVAVNDAEAGSVLNLWIRPIAIRALTTF